jgi:hypothetical protein
MSIAISIFRQSVVVAGFGAKNAPRFRPVRLFQVQERVYFLLSETRSLESYHLFTLMTQGREITVSGGQYAGESRETRRRGHFQGRLCGISVSYWSMLKFPIDKPLRAYGGDLDYGQRIALNPGLRHPVFSNSFLTLTLHTITNVLFYYFSTTFLPSVSNSLSQHSRRHAVYALILFTSSPSLPY